jgi:FKBP-type peptidyl-prolyl cis-trans isomerase SlyD
MINKDSIIELTYTIEVEGEIINESNSEKIKVGESHLLPGLQKYLTNLCDKNEKDVVGESSILTIDPSQGFGERKKELIVAIPKKMMNKNKINDSVTINLKDGRKINGIVKEENKDTFIVDCNHPLADKELIINLKVKGVA